MSEPFPASSAADDCTPMTAHESMLKALFESAQDIEAGPTWTVEEFAPRLAILMARAQRIAEGR